MFGHLSKGHHSDELPSTSTQGGPHGAAASSGSIPSLGMDLGHIVRRDRAGRVRSGGVVKEDRLETRISIGPAFMARKRPARKAAASSSRSSLQPTRDKSHTGKGVLGTGPWLG